MTDREIARRIRIRFPRFDASLYAKAKQPDKYGIELTQEAKDEEREALIESGIKLRRKRIRKERDDLQRLTIRIPKCEYIELQRLSMECGVKTDNLIINKAIETALASWLHSVWERR